MSVDMQLVGEITARLMDRVDDLGIQGVVTAVAVVVSIDDGVHATSTVICSEPQPYRQRGLLMEALDAVVEGSRYGP